MSLFRGVWHLVGSLMALTRRVAAVALVCLFVVASLGVPNSAFADQPQFSVELNKLEPQGNGCRVILVVLNESTTEFDQLKLDIVLFQPDGVVSRRFTMNLAPLRASKRSVKQFDLEGTPCDQVGSLLINDIVDCKTSTGPIENCLAGLTVKSLTKVQLSK